jgi:hypothetical protein
VDGAAEGAEAVVAEAEAAVAAAVDSVVEDEGALRAFQ